MEILINHCPVRWQAINNSHAIALQSDQYKMTYQQLDRQLVSLKNQLTTQVKVKKGQPLRLVCIASNSIELILLQLLCIRIGWLFCPLNPRFTEVEITQRLDALSSPYCWVANNNQLAHRLFNTLNIDFSNADSTLEETAESSHLSYLPIAPLIIKPQQACNIIFTSGTSGFPKAVVHSYHNHFFSALGSQSLIPLDCNDHNLLSLPLFHIGGYATVIRTIIAGACLHLTQSPLHITLLQQQKITHLSLVSTQLIRLLNDPLFNKQQCVIKHLLLGGSSFSDVLLNTLVKRGFNYHLSYGSTEMASQVATSDNNSNLQVLSHRQVKIHKGEIYLRGETRFIGYFQDKKLLKIAPEQWFASTDIGKLTGNKLQIRGRKDRQFISGGENIQPEEIERICLQHKSVKQVYICAIKDKQYGQRAVLFVLFAQHQNTHFIEQTKQLQQYLSIQLTRFKQPDRYLAWPQQATDNQALKIPQQTFLRILKKQGLI